MTTITDLIPDVITYLLTQSSANTSLGAATPAVGVFDGPVSLTGEQLAAYSQRLWIGFDAKNPQAEAGKSTQNFAYEGTSGGRRQEDGQVTCTAEAWDGEPVIASMRAQCKAITGAVEIMLRGSPSTGIGPGDSSMGGLVQWSQVADTAWYQSVDGESGASVMCVFTVTFTAYLNP